MPEKGKKRKKKKAVVVRKAAAAAGPANSHSEDVLRRTSSDALTPNAHKSDAKDDGAVDAPLVDQAYYHGALPRDMVEERLKRAGDFAVRLTFAKGDKKQEVKYIISVRLDSVTCKHFPITEMDSGWIVEKEQFSSIPRLVEAFVSSAAPLTAKTAAHLIRPVSRPPWLIRGREWSDSGVTLGKGHFGFVVRGRLRRDGLTEDRSVVIKKTRATMTDEERKEVIGEASLLLDNVHGNIVECLGIAADTLPVAIVLEFCEHCLLSFLRASVRVPELKLQWVREAAKALCFLDLQRVVHRDVSSRNCLLQGPALRLKLSDFGLARRLDASGEFRAPARNVPLQWSAPENFSGLWSAKSDVFSWGVLVWEIYADGRKPWDGTDKKQILANLDASRFLSFPAASAPPKVVFLVVRGCWLHSPAKRFSFLALQTALADLATPHYIPLPPTLNSKSH